MVALCWYSEFCLLTHRICASAKQAGEAITRANGKVAVIHMRPVDYSRNCGLVLKLFPQPLVMAEGGANGPPSQQFVANHAVENGFFCYLRIARQSELKGLSSECTILSQVNAAVNLTLILCRNCNASIVCGFESNG